MTAKTKHQTPKNAPHKPVRMSELGALRILDRVAWVAKVTEAMASTGGNVSQTAEVLGLSRRQMFRLIAEPDFNDVPRAGPGNPEHKAKSEAAKKAVTKRRKAS